MPRGLSLATLYVLLATIANSLLGGEPTLVDEWSDLSRVVVVGARTFLSDQIVEALRRNFTVLKAAHPAQPLDELPNTLAAATCWGYRSAGFLDAAVTSEFPPGARQIVLKVDEGERLRCGPVRVLGAHRLPVDRLIAAVTQPALPREALQPRFANGPNGPVEEWLDASGSAVEIEPALWGDGWAGFFTEQVRSQLAGRAEVAAADCGFSGADIDARFERAGPGVAALLLHVRNEGEIAAVSDVRIAGLQQHTEQDILNCIEWRPGTTWTREERVRVERRLWECGRFAKIRLATKSHFGNTTLHIGLAEVADVPRLGEPLSREAQALLRACHGLMQSRDDLCVRVGNKGWEGELVAATGRGAIIDNGNESNGAAVRLTPEGLRFFDHRSRSQFLIPAFGAGIAFSPEFIARTIQDPTAGLCFGWAAFVNPNQPPFRLDFRMAPSAALSLAYDSAYRSTWTNGVLSVRSTSENRFELQIDERTGRLVRLTAFRTKNAPRDFVNIHFEPGAFDRRADRLAAETSAYPERNAAGPMASVVELALGSYVRRYAPTHGLDAVTADRVTSAIAKLAASCLMLDDIARTLDLGLKVPHSQAENASKPREFSREFSVPAYGRDTPRSLEQVIGQLIVVHADRLFPRETWPWVAVRMGGFMYADAKDHFGLELKRLRSSPQFGPLSDLAVARSPIGKFDVRYVYLHTHRASRNASTAAIHRDLQPFIDPRGLVGRYVLRLADACRNLTVEETEALGRSLGTDSHFVTFIRRLQARRSLPIAAAVDVALQETLSDGLQQRLQAFLDADLQRLLPRFVPPKSGAQLGRQNSSVTR